MSSVMIEVENVGKRYWLHHEAPERYTALRDVLARKMKGLFRAQGSKPKASSSDEDFWALKDVSFQINQGEVVGIIGRNGAGKSTLLKILSRITEPTKGRIRLKGRVASLLEVGTGFHPELTGRENIFLNGAILGMSKAEIRSKFDAIVAFAEVERFLDTPVKRYSSGMYVRLAFAVAAHLEPEILVIDEVLAVGDAQFQKKCLGKMNEVAKTGRTVLFVSHQMAAVSSLTSKCFVLSGGSLVFDGSTPEAIERYVALGSEAAEAGLASGRGTHTAIISASLLDANGAPTRTYAAGSPMQIEVTFETDGAPSLSIEAFLVDVARQRVGMASLHQFHGLSLPREPGRYRTRFGLGPLWLASGSYAIDLTTSVVNSNWDHFVEDLIRFDVVHCNPGGQSMDFKHSHGYGTLALPVVSGPEFIRET